MSLPANAMYKVGDFCYFEVSSSGPYQIRRIEDLLKTSGGHVEVKTIAYCRKRDLPKRLQEKIATYEKEGKEVPDIHLDDDEADDMDEPSQVEKNDNTDENVSEDQLTKHRLGHREVYLTRLAESLPASLIRGKCTVYLLAECEKREEYLKDEDLYYYTHTWDPNSNSLTQEKGGNIRVGSGFQADVSGLPSPLLQFPPADADEKMDEKDEKVKSEDEEETEISDTVLMWEPGRISDSEIDNFVIIMRSVGTFGRALDWNTSVKQPGLHLTAASASRDITIQNAMNTLHNNSYDLSRSLKELVSEGPLICRDQMEVWTAAEAGLFEEALDKYGKDFRDIKQDLLPWKAMNQIVEYYYMWKTSDRFVQNKRVRTALADFHLKQIYIPPYVQDDRLPTNEVHDGPGANNCCEGCRTKQSSNWYAWGGLGGLRNSGGFRLCYNCWQYWKKYGDLKRPIKGDKKIMLQHGPGIPYTAHQKQPPANTESNVSEKKLGYLLPPNQRSAQIRNMSVVSPRSFFRTRPAIYFIATQMMKQVRRVGEHIYKPRRAARRPFHWINSAPIKEHYQNADTATVQRSKRPRTRKLVPVAVISSRLMERNSPGHALLTVPASLRTNGKDREKESRVPSPPYKRVKLDSGEMAFPAKPKVRSANGRLPFPDAPEDFFYHLSPHTKKERRKAITTVELKKAGRAQRLMFTFLPNPGRLHHFLSIVPTQAVNDDVVVMP
ncbi:metastasis-associated protein MTA3-like [Paramacrobiotus metropolitanus]|uniref:metastasis-associated protein MTA3-like n=1 Tax=Paramacrobiotus metropolitanus TaxID=2943436 RepID=UPI002445E584|nr:metastasis-associated protein MTA3-like [Paramacrobiotus metropolitanus]